jgi:hypothetical protein
MNALALRTLHLLGRDNRQKKYRQRGPSQDLIGDASKDESLKTAQTVRRHRDEFRIFLVCGPRREWLQSGCQLHRHTKYR